MIYDDDMTTHALDLGELLKCKIEKTPNCNMDGFHQDDSKMCASLKKLNLKMFDIKLDIEFAADQFELKNVLTRINDIDENLKCSSGSLSSASNFLSYLSVIIFLINFM